MDARVLDGQELLAWLSAGSEYLKANKHLVDRLNVFPVPDGDTGTNMSLTLESGVRAAQEVGPDAAGAVAKAFSRGVLMGARGNSGVILSQLFRGFALHVEKAATVDALSFAEALQAGVRTAYQAVLKPVEGTMLTVAREAAKNAVRSARAHKRGAHGDPFIVVLEAWLQAARSALERTPELLAVLKQAGVVDAGGYGLILIFEGLYRAARKAEGAAGADTGESRAWAEMSPKDSTDAAEHDFQAMAGMRPEDIRYGYCTEVIIALRPEAQSSFDLAAFRARMTRFGDSLLAIADDDLVKVHVHTENPGAVLAFAQEFGELKRIKIDNMREQLRNIRKRARDAAPAGEDAAQDVADEIPKAKQAIVAVASGSGFHRLFQSLGVSVIVEGGQTMNPSTEELLAAVRRAYAETVFLLPNNANIILAAKQAASLSESAVIVVPTDSIPSGIAAAIAFHPEAAPEDNVEKMKSAAQAVRTIQLTTAVRDTEHGGQFIKSGAWIAVSGGEIVAHGAALIDVARQALSRTVDGGASVVTAYWGEGADPSWREALRQAVETDHPDVEYEAHEGAQPIYPLILSVE